jgi:hypothetical protein
LAVYGEGGFAKHRRHSPFLTIRHGHWSRRGLL